MHYDDSCLQRLLAGQENGNEAGISAESEAGRQSLRGYAAMRHREREVDCPIERVLVVDGRDLLGSPLALALEGGQRAGRGRPSSGLGRSARGS